MRFFAATGRQVTAAGDEAHAGRGTPYWLLVAGTVALCYFAQPLNLFYTVAPAASVDTQIRTIEDGSMARQLALLSGGLWAVAWLIARRPRLRLNGRLAGLALAFLFVVVASIGWADDPLLSAKRAGALLALTACCLALAWQVGVARLASFVMSCGMIFAVMSIGAELAFGTFTPLDPGYRFSGLTHPNDQGIYCGCLALAAVSLSRRGRPGTGAYTVVAALGLLLLLLTKSRVSLASALVGLAFYAALTSARARYWLLLASTAGAIAAVPFIFLGARGLAAMWALLSMGRQEDVSTFMTLTGRTELWQALLPYVAERPLLGHGYGGFWGPQRLAALVQHEGWLLGSAHSQYLDVLLQVGAVGLGIFCAIGVETLAMLVRRYASRREDDLAFAAGLFVLVAVNMLVESRPLEASLPMLSCLMVVAGLAVIWGGREQALRS